MIMLPKPLLLLTAALLIFIVTGYAKDKPVTPDGSKPNEYSAYLFSAANVLYYDNQLQRAEEIYRLALKFDPKSAEIRKALFNTLLNRVNYNEIQLSDFAGYVDTLMTEKGMDKLMLEQAYDVYAQLKDNSRAERILKIYLKKYATARAYSSLFYLEQTMYGLNRLELLDKAFKLGKGDSPFLNSLGLLYLAFDEKKAEQIWLTSAQTDTTAQAAANLWSLYSRQDKPDKLIKLYHDLSTPENLPKLNEIMAGELQSGGFATIMLVKEPIIASGDQMQILTLMQASWPAEDKVTFQKARSLLKEDELNQNDRQLLHFMYVLYSLKNDDKADALHQMSFLDGKRALDALLMLYRNAVLSDKLQPDSLAVIQVKENLRQTLEPASETQLAAPLKAYLLAYADSLGIDNEPQVADSLAFACVKWFYDNNRKTYDTYLFLVQHYSKSKQFTMLDTLLDEALAEYPEDASLLNWKGYSYVLQEVKLEEAEALIRRALQLAPDNAFYLDSLAWLYYTKGDYKTALEYMEIPMQLEEIPGEISLHYALIQLALNNIQTGIDYLNYTVNTNNDPDSAAKALELLKQMGRR